MSRMSKAARSTSGLTDRASSPMKVPEAADLRFAVRRQARLRASALDRRTPLGRPELESLGRTLLADVGAATEHLGFAMVALSNEFWRDQFAATPFQSRLLLLPHCLRQADVCRGDYDDRGLTCVHCRECHISDLVHRAESLGYRVLVADGTPAALELLLDNDVDAILGVACLDSLEKSFRRVVELGVPHAAVPLLVDGCVATRAEVGEILAWMELRDAATISTGRAGRTRTYVPLLRAARDLFQPGALDALLAPELVPTPSGPAEADSDPLSGTQSIALDWLRVGGKRFRPFITLAGYAAKAIGPEAFSPQADLTGVFPDVVKRSALAVEALHKASLVHDDIEDDDAYRYGRQTLHRRYGPAVAVNVGDYLIGLGYRLIAAGPPHAGTGSEELSPQCATETLQAISRAHMKLAQGQGAELLWRRRRPEELKPLDLLSIYALKTAPAFEAAMFVGLRAAGPVDAVIRHIRTCCRYLGIAYQVKNDLKDWDDDGADKLLAGQDLLSMRPTILQAFAMEGQDPSANRDLVELTHSELPRDVILARLRRNYQARGVFDKAARLVDKYRERAHAAAATIEPAALRELMDFILDTVLA